jgi:hypothetical protein
MAGSFISSDPKKYDNFQHFNSTILMSSSSRTVAGTVEQFCFEVCLAMISLFSLFPARKKLSACTHPFNQMDQHFRLYSSPMFAKNNGSEHESVCLEVGRRNRNCTTFKKQCLLHT